MIAPVDNISQSFSSDISKSVHFFELLYGDNMRDMPKRSKGKSSTYDNKRQWIHIGGKEKMKSVATKSTLFAVLSDPDTESTYYTPNGYYKRNERLTESLRWLNAFVFDIDCIGESPLDVLDRLHCAGLPLPTAIIKTPSGGYHVTYIFKEAVRATPRATRLYTAIMAHVARDIQSDLAAVGANRIFRTPSEDSMVYFEPTQVYDFEVFKIWRDVNHPYESSSDYRLVSSDIMSSHALQVLLNTPCREGERDNTCFTLALAMKASGWSEDKAMASIQAWHERLCSKKTTKVGKRSLTLREAMYKVKYVYRKDNYVGPSATKIRELSGEMFHFKAQKRFEGKKDRACRIRSHYDEWKNDFVQLLRKERELIGSQSEIAHLINCPLSTFKLIIKMLEDERVIECESKRGRGGGTVIRLINEPSNPNKEEKEEVHITTIYQVDFVRGTVTDVYLSYTERKSGRILIDRWRNSSKSPPDPD